MEEQNKRDETEVTESDNLSEEVDEEVETKTDDESRVEIKENEYFRTFTLDRSAIDEDTRTVTLAWKCLTMKVKVFDLAG